MLPAVIGVIDGRDGELLVTATNKVGTNNKKRGGPTSPPVISPRTV